ncbi:MAG: hypothetical protein HY690_12445 [Chloroflexi bacterium]|nr:hypothetical protein [Chloroflexota bacterium]
MTSDDWNERMLEVGVVPLHASTGKVTALAPLVCDAPPLQALPGRLVSVAKEALGGARLVLDERQMARVEDALCEVLALRGLCREPPARPRSPSGPVSYPRWGEVYYVAGQNIGGERKRYVVVSNDFWNSASESVIAVRTTTAARRWGLEFPAIQRGAARACCGDAASLVTRHFNLRQRPQPEWLTTEDMAAIARGLVETHQLHAALSRKPG